MTPPRLRVDHVSIAVRSFDRALDFFLEHFPAVVGEPRQPGYDGDFLWGDFTIGRFKIELIDHVSLALRATAPAVDFFSRHLGAEIETPIHEGYDGTFRLLQMRLRDYRIELMESRAASGFLGRFLERRGEGLHHLSLDVDDLDGALAPLERSGVRIVDRFELRPGWRTAFLHPRSCFGVLVQLWQVPPEEWDRPPTPAR